jgi:pyruvate formate lyase activating enzyme
MNALGEWVAGLKDVHSGRQGREIPLHVSRFFPRYHMPDRPPTDVSIHFSLVEAARKHLETLAEKLDPKQ